MFSAPNFIHKSLCATFIAGTVFLASEATRITAFIGTAEATITNCQQAIVNGMAISADFTCDNTSSLAAVSGDGQDETARPQDCAKSFKSTQASTPVITLVDVTNSHGMIADILQQSNPEFISQ